LRKPIPFSVISFSQITDYAGSTSPDYYLLSPINGSLEDLGKITIFIGSKDLLVADARKLRWAAASKGIHLNYYEYENMIHAWMLLNLPASKKAKEQIIEVIRSQ
jgi:epsilon-lactone hydrolase